MSGAPDRLVADYLRRLNGAASVLPAARRSELVAEIRAHIDDALREVAVADEVAVRNVLERLGSVEEIVAAAESTPAGGGVLSRRPGRLEIAALIVLGVSGAVPLLGWLLGAALVAASDAW